MIMQGGMELEPVGSFKRIRPRFKVVKSISSLTPETLR